ncbi:MAG: hypothetical protein K2X87_27420 [Gemmataceae bacterium]|nr:hypothetical protein [Gemmataceae bacterium]
MFSSLLALGLVAGAGPQPPTPPKVQMPRLTDGPAPLTPLSALTPATRPVVTNAPVPAPPLTARTVRPDPAAAANPFLGRRTADFPTVRGPSAIPSTASNLVRTPGTVGHFNDLFDRLYVPNVIARDREAAKEAEARRLPAGQFETRNVYEYDFRSGQPRPASTVILTDPRHQSVMSAGFRRSEMTPTVTVGRPPLPSATVGDRFAEQRMARDVAAIKEMAARQAELDRQRLGYDRVRSLLTPPGPDAVSTVRRIAPRPAPVVNSTPVPKPVIPLVPGRGVRVYDAPIGPQPAPGWRPPMAALPKSPAPTKSTPLP